MNLPEKLQTLRKQNSFSQEELAEKLGVSRQAVSKWESGAAIPEVEKLIELSRIFGVSLNELLQVEETTEQAQSPAISQEFSEDQVAKIELLIDKHIAASKQSVKSKRFIVFSVATVLIIALFYIFTFSKIGRINDEISDLQFRISDINSSVQSQLSSFSANFSSLLESQNSIVSTFNCEIVAVDLANQIFTAKLSVLPKTFTDNMSFTFTAEFGETSLPVAAVLNGSAFETEITNLPMSTEINLMLTYEQDGIKQNEPLEPFSLPLDYFLLDIQSSCSRYSFYPLEQKLTFNNSDINTTISFSKPFDPDSNLPYPYPISASVQILINDELYREYPIDLKNPSSGNSDTEPAEPAIASPSDSGSANVSSYFLGESYTTNITEVITLQEGDSIKLVSVCEDSNHYKYIHTIVHEKLVGSTLVEATDWRDLHSTEIIYPHA